MAKVERIQVTAYLSEAKHIRAWEQIKAHYGESVGDSTILRTLIEDFASRLGEDGMQGVSPNRIGKRLADIESKLSRMEEQERKIRLLEERLTQLENKTP